MSALGGKADITIAACLLSHSLLGVKRTCVFALQMSAYDLKRTSRHDSRCHCGLRLLHRHHVAVEVGNDPDGAGDDEKDDQHAEGQSQNVIRAVGAAAQMQEEHKVDADLREGKYNQSHRNARRPQQVGLRHDERCDRRQNRKRQPHRIGEVAGRGLMLLDTRRAVVEQMLVCVRQCQSPIR